MRATAVDLAVGVHGDHATAGFDKVGESLAGVFVFVEEALVDGAERREKRQNGGSGE